MRARALASVTAAAGALYVLVTVDVATGGWLPRLDRHVAAAVTPIHAGWQTSLAHALAHAGYWMVECAALLAVALVLTVVRRESRILPASVTALVVLALVGFGCKGLVDRTAPLGHGSGSAYPSGHAASAVVAAGVVAVFVGRHLGDRARRVLLGLAVLWALLIGWSRVHLDVHWLSDVIGGELLGLTIVGAVALAFAAVAASSVVEVRTLGAYADAWDRLAAQAPVPSPFLRSWWLESVATDGARYLLVLDGDELVGGLPLEARRYGWVQRYRFLGGGTLCPDHLDLVARPDRVAEVAEALRTWALTGERLLDLDGIADGARLLDVFPDAIAEDVAPYEPLTTYDAYVAARSPRFPRRIRRAERGLPEGLVIGPAPTGEVIAAMDAFIGLHAVRDDRTAITAESDRLRRAVLRGSSAGEVELHVARDAGQVVCVLIAFTTGGRLSMYQSARLLGDRYAGVGTIVELSAIQHACATGMTEVDFLRGGEEYKTALSAHRRTLWRVRMGIGVTAKTALAARSGVRRLLGR